MTTSIDAHEHQYSHINGSTQDLLERFAVSELCKGWPVYRDSSEWKNYRDLFAKDAIVWTTWSKGRSIDDFIAVSKMGKDRGDFIMHRECGTLVEYAAEHDRAIGKMKGTITQRFKTSPSEATPACPVGTEFDVDCDCRFIFFCLKDPDAGGAWKAQYVKLFYEKDKIVPIDGNRAPVFAPELLDSFPEGYKYLGAAQSTLGYPVTKCLPTGSNHESWFQMYKKMELWLSGLDVDLWVDDDYSPDLSISSQENNSDLSSSSEEGCLLRSGSETSDETPEATETGYIAHVEVVRVDPSSFKEVGTHAAENCGISPARVGGAVLQRYEAKARGVAGQWAGRLDLVVGLDR